ncbi:Sigma-Y antisigma factor component [Filibacter tadaridae]|uniref:Uncharacterized protein n=1 Tax=Filibacter tadaridae TaxID=2483811 RepID=A0A3P5X5V2_9BACL|nr:hypothetical protein FILTAD_02162 [Filibacter tadaridae]
MSERFELSFKNKVVRMLLIIIVPTLFVQMFLRLFTELPRIIPAVIPVISLIVFSLGFIFINGNRRKSTQLPIVF